MPVNKKLRSVVKNFASVSEHAARAREILNSEPIHIDTLAGVIELDVSLASKLLQIANSPFFGLSREILTVKDAIVVMGLLSVRNTITMAAVTNQMKTAKADAPLDTKALWLRSLTVACACKYYSKKFTVDPQKAFMLGMFHLIGRMALNNCIDEYRDVVAFQEFKECPMREAEIGHLEFDHKQLGVELVKKWHLPDIVEHAIAETCGSEEAQPYADVLELAKYIAQQMNAGDNFSYEPVTLNPELLEKYGLTEEDVENSFKDIEEIKSESMELIH